VDRGAATTPLGPGVRPGSPGGPAAAPSCSLVLREGGDLLPLLGLRVQRHESLELVAPGARLCSCVVCVMCAYVLACVCLCVLSMEDR
jgi:hypothetical protein